MIPLRKSRQVRAQKSRSVVKTLPAPTGGWNARDVLSAMPTTDAVALVNWFPETTDVILRYGSELWGNLSGGIGAGNALLLDGVSGLASTADAAPIDVTGDIDLRCYANLDNWTTSTAQFFIAKGTAGDASYQFFILDGKLGALLYTAAGVIAGAFLSDTVVPAVNGSPLWVRFTCDIDNGAGFSIGTFYTSSNGTTWTQLGGTWPQAIIAAIANSAQPLQLGSGFYPAAVTFYAPPVICDSADFDGLSDHMTRGAGLTGAADSKIGIFSCWLRLDGGDGTLQYLLDSTSDTFTITRSSSGTFNIDGIDTGFFIALRLATTSSYMAGATWIHLLASWNLAVAGSGRFYVNDANVKNELSYVDSTLDYTNANWSIGAKIAGSSKLDGCLAEVYFAPGQYLDFSVEANRRKFISSTGKPVYLNTDGSLPTGTAPIIYQHLADGEAVADFAINRATGGNFTITGTLTTGTTSPSD